MNCLLQIIELVIIHFSPQEYLRTEPSQRNIDSTLIFLVHQRKEPESFIDVFPSWNKNMWKVE